MGLVMEQFDGLVEVSLMPVVRARLDRSCSCPSCRVPLIALQHSALWCSFAIRCLLCTGLPVQLGR